MKRRIEIEPTPLTAEAFAPFGEVIQTRGAQHFEMNAGKLERYYDLASIDIGAENGGRPVMSIAHCKQTTALPMDIKFLERHPHGSQAIFPLFKQTMLAVVAAPGEQVNPEHIHAFYSDGTQGINFQPGTWHLPIIALEPGQQFMLIDRGGARQNCDEFYFDEEHHITLSRLKGSIHA